MSGEVLWLNPAAGVAGDMLLAALLAAGADEAHVRDQLGRLDLPGWELDVVATSRRGLTATAVRVRTAEDGTHRPWSEIEALLASAALDPAVADGARRTFRLLAEAEGRVHGIPPHRVHFHEVGALDALVDVVGTWAAFASLGAPRVVAAPVGLGSGLTEMAHGAVPVPAPAVLEMLVGRPTTPVPVDGETATPTGVALLVTLVDDWGRLPAGTVRAVGRGAGTWDPPTHANVLTAVLTEATEGSVPTTAAVPRVAVLLEANLDDATPEVLGHLLSRALAAGADDAWVVPVTMKKSRPAHQVRLLGRPERADELRDLLARETGTLGVRQWEVTKYEWPRSVTEVVVDGHPVRVKDSPLGVKPEFDDVAALAAATGRPFREVADRAVARYRQLGDATDAEGRVLP